MKPYYDADGITLYHGDCREILPTLPERCAGLVLTDPPYSEQTHAGAVTGRRDAAGHPAHLVTFACLADSDLAQTFDAIGRVAARWVVATVDWKHAAALERTPPMALRFVRCGCWVKRAPMPQLTGDRPAQGWEAVAILHRDGGKMHWRGGGAPAVWTALAERAGDYPTQKPLPLVSEWIGLFADPGDLVIDPFCGSGTTLLAAKRRGHKAIGIDVSAHALEITVRRLAQRELFGSAA